MDINKRTILWIVFAVSLVALWNEWMISTGRPSMFAPTPAKTAQAPAKAPAGTPSAVGTTAGAAAVPGNAAPFQSQTVTITTDVFKVDIDTLGGQIKRLELLKFKDGIDPTKNQLLFQQGGNRVYLAQSGLVGAANLPNHNSGFTVRPGPRALDGNNQIQLVMDAEQGGVRLTKTYTFKRGDYVIDVRHDVTNVGTAPVNPELYLQLVHDGNKPEGSSWFNSSFTGPTLYTEADHYKKLTFEKVEKEDAAKRENPNFKPDHPTKADNGWVAISQHFFVSALVPQTKLMHDIFTRKVDTNTYAIGVVQPLGALAPGATVSNTAKLYSGPQEEAALEKVTPGLELVKDYGMLTIVAKPMYWVMEKIHGALGNWGWTIIAFTILIKLLFFPLSAASYRSMAKMKVVTPKMTAIRERYKGDPQKMNQAMMELYKTEKINPLGGCLPILVQMPVFISLYWVLNASVEMRGAPWALWIHDLTKPDPFFVLPVLYAISMYVTMKLNPQPADPAQAKMMLFMPLAFSVMFLFFPSGLVLYWVVNNLFSIAQQWVITKKLAPAEAK
ncbi:YidC/Oxa1 family membrane protein insertase [Pseudoduganella flava]|uniref:Membrane protein insertase YidC n=1 Tax=Pseudoduganella flava TaxID=871742 RepID=A0A562PCE6_9BURK|nr:membrane protein insertase YidC [Pseudoduganella flava]QGZ40135.1 membrane protein insertase YidC [Pseudoduganella flava]TWI42084.1 YidC/Oxa1 family membrane protein insertase [Pseudoduganella flava]